MEQQATAEATDSDAIRDDFIPASRYLAPETHRLERERMWPRVWHMACRVEEIPRVGDFVTYEILDQSILVARTAPDRVQALANVCRHRGRRLCDAERGNTAGWWCGFHGWRYHLDGSIAYVHTRDDWAGCPLDDADVGLTEMRADTWAGWVWVNLDPGCEPLATFLGPVREVLDPFELEHTRVAWHETIIAPVNWKVVVEAFNESYHATATHRSGWRNTNPYSRGAAHGVHGMFAPVADRAAAASGPKPMEFFDASSGTWQTARSAAEAIWAYHRHLHDALHAMTLEPAMAAAERLLAEAADVPAHAVMARFEALHREEMAARGVAWPERLTAEAIARAGTDWHIFPNSIVLPTADGALWYRVRPQLDDPQGCIFDIWCLGRFAPGAEPAVVHGVSNGFEEFRGKNPFLEEDFANLAAVQAGMRSHGWPGARVNPVQELQIVNFHRALAAYAAS